MAIKLTPQQSEVTSQLRDFLRSKERCFILKGYAGTGKTFLIGQLAKGLAAQNKQVTLMAPTGRAARVLSRKTGCLASTIHQAIYNLQEMVEHDDTHVAFKFYFRVKDVETDNLDLVVIVDEASMVSDQYSEGEFIRFGSGRLLADLIGFLRLNDPLQKSKLIFVGDPAQLPPVNSPTSPALDAAYLNEVHSLFAKEYELTDVVRQATDSPILREATAIRETLRSGFHNRLNISTHPPEIESVLEPDLPSRFVEANADTRLPQTICVAYTNATCLNLNVAIRSKRVSGDGMYPPIASDVLLVIRNNALTGLLNGDLISILQADQNAETVRVHVGSEHVDLVFRNLQILAESEDGNGVQMDVKIVENILFSEKRDLSPLEQKALYVHFKIRHPKLRSNSKGFTEALRSDPYFNALQVKFGYAVTCHKAQGGEWDDVFIYFENARTDALALRWAYTALTRARKRVIGINLPNRMPWPGMVAGVAKPMVIKPIAPQRQDATEIIATTQWDEMFPEEPSFLREQHRRMAAALKSTGITIENVVVKVAHYYWRYDVSKNGARASLRLNFRRSGTITPQVLSTAGSDQALAQEVLPLLRVAPLPALPQPKPVEFPDDKPYLRTFYDDFMVPRTLAAGASILRVDHHPFLEKYYLVKGSSNVVINVYYNSRGTITSMVKGIGDEELYQQVLDDA
jgi:tRNA A37 threonylcarbamoyladenosine biosynthesis protein TsaE